MNVCTRIYNQSAIYYSEGKYGHNSNLRLPGEERRSPKKEKDGRMSTKEWVRRSFYSKPQNDDKNSTPAAAKVSKPSANRANQEAGAAAKSGPNCKTKKISGDQKTREHEGKPAVYFKQSLVDSQAEKFEFCLVGKFPGSRPSLTQIREWVAKELKLKDGWTVTLLDHCHVFFKLDNKDDMLSIWARNRWLIKGHLMRVFKWNPIFHPCQGEEPSLAAVWILLPSLPILFFQEEFLSPIASLVGRVLAVDGPTRSLSRTNVARVCVEANLLQTLPRQVWIGVGEGGFWQDVSYEKLPSYCSNCLKQGHPMSICKFTRSFSEEMRKDPISGLQNPNSKTKEDRFSRKQFSQKRARSCTSVENKDESNQTCRGDSPEKKRSNGRAVVQQRKKEANGTSEERGESSYVIPTGQSVSSKTQNSAPTGVVDVEKSRSSLSQLVGKNGKEKDGLDGENILQKVKCPSKEAGDQAKKHGDDAEKKDLESNRVADWKQGNPAAVGLMTNIIDKGSPGKNSPKRSKFSSNKRLFFWKRKTKNSTETEIVEATTEDFGSSLKRYQYSEIIKMTNNFRHHLGHGGFGKVYKGKLPDDRFVAVKIPSDYNGAEKEFISEITTIGRTRHVNVVSLLGFCYEDSKSALVYEFMTNGSLEKFIYLEGPRRLLGRQKLHQIAVGIAQGLEYLHRECILHRDIKPTNILLDEDYQPKISDFGLSKHYETNVMTDSHTRMAGTTGYMAPELVMFGRFSSKSDVYGYGTMLLEMVTGMRAFDPSAKNFGEKHLRNWVYKKLKEGKNMGRGGIPGVAEEETDRKMMLVSLWCIEMDPEIRPSMERVLKMLEGSIKDLKMPPNASK